jgi:UDP-N-acetylmuramoyl-L-alanyl-D-glutamate--2,6-diaminopimelate ligase
VRLGDLVADAARRDSSLGLDIAGDPDIDIAGLEFDSRRVNSGDLFLCVPGEVTDGHHFIDAAVAQGASALVVDRPSDAGVTQVRTTDVRRAMAHLANAFHGDPSRDLQVVGITGTNGKTTTAHLVAAVLRHAGAPVEVLGTLSGARTTPEAPELQARLRAMVDNGVRAVAMEISSHALVQHRVTGMHIDVGVFTNLSPDHLDYHGDLDSYFEAKALLFRTGLISAAVVNVDDERGRQLAEEMAKDADFPASGYTQTMLEDVTVTLSGSSFRWRGHRVQLALPGRFNMENAVAAAEAVRLLGMSDAAIATGLSHADQVPGRFEVVVNGGADDVTVIVDYSHTPAGIEQVLRSVREIEPDAAVCIVFGAGGDRDTEKRPLMGAAAAVGADHVIVTSDNPRSEDPQSIVDDILGGISSDATVRVDVVLDRRQAIALALESHGADDVIVVAGKGHEITQTIGTETLAFDDCAVVRELVGGGLR